MDFEKQEGLNNEDGKSFAELLDESFTEQTYMRPGQKVQGHIVTITPEWIFIDLGSKSEGYIARQEMVDKSGALTVKEGDVIHAYFLSSRNNERLFTTKLGKGEAGREHLYEAYRSGIPIEGFVEKEIKGGFEIKVSGGVKGFCPFSQMDIRRVTDPKEYIGRHITFKIIEYAERGRKIIFSNRVIKEEELKKKKEALKEILQEGMAVRGTVTAIKNFGAFVDLDGIQGLVPISEITWGHVENINDFLTVGQEIEPVIMSLDWDSERITLSLKKTLANPWDDVEMKYPVGTRHAGRISRLTKFGAFVELEPGIDGLLHISKLGNGKRINHPSDVVTAGEVLNVEIEKLDSDNKRISLTGVQQAHEEEINDDGDTYTPPGEKAAVTFGTFGDLLKNKSRPDR
ncbi:MAG: 30S ribosomal protein S1 [Deltaproteobacteria bacterium]|nr:30S ribosomal protein S1 [Deltaproteobacteria bacterium]MBN2688146.1 30S ribosomal protein S1 [Deltaproteobacteria bacterium]